MTSTTFFIIFIPILSVILLAVNLLLAPHNPYQEKDSPFECGFNSFREQNRTQFAVSFFIFGLLFLLFDLEILLVYPYSVSSYTNDIYGLGIMLLFFVLLTLGFIFELGKGALTIDSEQTSVAEDNLSDSDTHISLKDITIMQSSMLEMYPLLNSLIVNATVLKEINADIYTEFCADGTSVWEDSCTIYSRLIETAKTQPDLRLKLDQACSMFKHYDILLNRVKDSGGGVYALEKGASYYFAMKVEYLDAHLGPYLTVNEKNMIRESGQACRGLIKDLHHSYTTKLGPNGAIRDSLNSVEFRRELARILENDPFGNRTNR